MNLIDHRILIPTSPERVWHFVGDLKRNTEWQTNCRSISMLNPTAKPQPGTRLRITPDRGREYVLEITAWYDRFGYEYTIVEGGSFRESKGTLRLQEVPEGTIVQWTFSFKPGLFGGSGRSQETQIIDSLRGLYKLITKSKEVETFQAKSLMRDDPGVEARASYRPRHPFGDTAEGTASHVKGSQRQPTKPQPPVSFSEPPVKPDDTKPRPVVVVPTPPPDSPSSPPAVVIPVVPYTPAGSPIVEPDFLLRENDVPFADVPSEKLAPTGSATPIPYVPPPLLTPPPITPIDTPAVKPITENVPPVLKTTPDTAPPLTEPPVKISEPAPDPLSDTAHKARQDTAPIAAMYPTPAEVQPVVKVTPAPRRDKLMDTSRISVFEIFGLPKPSETQELTPIAVDEKGDPIPVSTTPTPTAAVESPAATPAPVAAASTVAAPTVSEARRLGRRALMRRKAVKVRLAY